MSDTDVTPHLRVKHVICEALSATSLHPWPQARDVLDGLDEKGYVIASSTPFALLSEWIDQAPQNAARDDEARTWGRLAKLSEESGEVIAAYIGATGQNPRKGVTHNRHDVAKELLDVAVTALSAYEHITGNRGCSIPDLMNHIDSLVERAGISTDEEAQG